MNDIHDTVRLIETAALEGGRRMIELAGRADEVQMSWKEDNSMVLSLDLASQEKISEALKGHPVISEEDPASHTLLKTSSEYFVVDPLDGTHTCRRMLKNHGRFVAGQVGFGPMIGVVREKRLVAATFFSLTESKIFTAVKGLGSFEYDWKSSQKFPPLKERKRLIVKSAVPLNESAVLYYPGRLGEMDFVKVLREKNFVENVYRFGGFANDCTRLARGYEQIHVQFSLKAWDLSAALIAIEAGFGAIMDPLGKKSSFDDWVPKETNPLLMVHKDMLDEMRKLVLN